jgi:phosphopantothenoylcysteine decarboxylase/phosphopantothenate--cysteine ligase
LQGKHIIVGVTGGIAAYKTAILVRELVKRGAEVKVIMTEKAKEFITPLTLATLSRNPVLVDFFDPTDGRWNSHVSLGLWADAYIIAPATANTLAKMAHGIADNLLTTTYLSARCPVFAAPAMDLDMYAHVATQENLQTLRNRGVQMIEPASGFLASGLEGKGRMAEPEVIAQFVADKLQANLPLTGKNILITAGPTYEKIDPVRFIGNYSSGKMGYAIAETCAQLGATVTLVSGPVQIKAQHANIHVTAVESAAEMFQATTTAFSQADAAILCAAVADFTPATKANSKIKRGDSGMSIELQPTKDIAAALGSAKKDTQVLVGFALETDNEAANAASKLARKNLDFIVLNSLRNPGTCFGYDNNQITIIDRNGQTKAFPAKSKQAVAADIVENLCEWLNK